jgi:cell division protein FtsB
MKARKILLSLWLATAAFCLLQIVAGPNGILVTTQLQADAARLDARLAQLAEDNARLRQIYQALNTSAEAVRLEARRLGWFQSGDVPVKVVEGQSFQLPPESYSFTQVLQSPVVLLPDAFFRLSWFLLVAVFWGVLSLLDLLREREVGTRALDLRGRLDLFRQ